MNVKGEVLFREFSDNVKLIIYAVDIAWLEIEIYILYGEEV